MAGCRHAGIDGLEIIDPDEDPENYAQRAAEQCASASRCSLLPNLYPASRCSVLPPASRCLRSASASASAAAFER